MNWPTWNEAAIAAAVSGLVALVLRRFWPTSKFSAAVAPAAQEFALIASLYSLWRIARELPLTHEAGAIDRSRGIVRLQHDLRFPTELSLQQFVLRYDWLARYTNTYYASFHVPVLIGFLIWLYVGHRDKFPHWRNGLVIVTACCLVVRFVRVAPPRFLPDLGYIDLSTRYGMNLYGPVGTGVSDQFAAMPSIHVAWAAVVSFGVVAATRSKFRWLALLYVLATFLAVSATGNHWWLDGIVAVGFLCAGLAIDTWFRRRGARRRALLDAESVVDDAHDPAADHSAFQVGTLDALMAGGYDGDATIGDLLAHGDLGFGTIQGLGGELVVLDGRAFVVDGDGGILAVSADTCTPFAVVCRFAPIVDVGVSGPLDLAELHEFIDVHAPAEREVVALRVDGRFQGLRLRSVYAQHPPYPPLADITAKQSEWAVASAVGSLVGFRFPDATAGVEVPGYHLHFLSDDRRTGGHVLAATLIEGTLLIDGSDELHVELPADEDTEDIVRSFLAD